MPETKLHGMEKKRSTYWKTKITSWSQITCLWVKSHDLN